jgi:uncharacterized protein
MEIAPGDVVLVGAAFVVGFGTTILGSTGGLLLAIMASVLPPPLAVPAHAVVEAARNGIAWRRIGRLFDSRIVLATGFGSFVGIGLAASFAKVVPDHAHSILLGAFLLWACWWPVPEPGRRFAFRLPLMGGLSGACSVYLGETGPLIRPFIAGEPVDPALVPGSVTAVAAVQHGLKVVAFVLIGVDYLAILPVLAAMLVAGLVGTMLGARLPVRLPVRLVALGIRLVVSVLAIRLVLLATGWV